MVVFPTFGDLIIYGLNDTATEKNPKIQSI